MDFSTILQEKRDMIVDRWTRSVFEDKQIEATDELTFNAVRNSLPRVLEALAVMLQNSDASLEHGSIRVEQGFEPAEIAREYRILRTVVFTELEDDLVKVAQKDMLWIVRLIDNVIDEAIARCFESYTQGRIHELEQLKSQLQLTNQELTRLVRSNQNHLSHLAHELKTPLTSIIGYADLFLRQQQQPNLKDTYPQMESIERVLRSGRLLLQMINNTLELSRQHAEQMRLQLIPTDVRKLVNIVVEMIDPLARAKDLTLTVNCDYAPNDVVTDPLRFQQILTNLLSNAIRYTQKGRVHVVCEAIDGDQWAISVSDSGIGISSEDQHHIFEPYFQVNSVDVPPKEDQPKDEGQLMDKGTGLGLAVVSQLVDLMQGEIQVFSKPAQGSTFKVVFPLNLKQV